MNQLSHMQFPISIIPKKLIRARTESVKPCLINLQKDTKGFGSRGWSGCQVHLLSILTLTQPAGTFGRHSTVRFTKQMNTVDGDQVYWDNSHLRKESQASSYRKGSKYLSLLYIRPLSRGFSPAPLSHIYGLFFRLNGLSDSFC